MNHADRQTEYWNRVAEDKEFTNPLDSERLGEFVPLSARILDVGCGYGRTWADLRAAGYAHIIGLDISSGMIERGQRQNPQADLRLWDGHVLPFDINSFDAVLLFAVLTCIPSDDGQRDLISEIERVLRPGGVLYVSDYPIQEDARNQSRYARYASLYGTYGVFALPEGVVLRHHTRAWIQDLLAPFQPIGWRDIDTTTMNGNRAKVFQYFGRKR